MALQQKEIAQNLQEIQIFRDEIQISQGELKESQQINNTLQHEIRVL